jgi:hypothetical protein
MCFDSYYMGFNVSVELDIVERNVIPKRKITLGSCSWCLHFSKSLTEDIPVNTCSQLLLFMKYNGATCKNL